MGDRGQTATAAPFRRDSHYSRWEIGGKPQPAFVVVAVWGNYSRWEIGGKPQRVFASYHHDYSRWEIGGKPQLRAFSILRAIIADGRSGANRNRPKEAVPVWQTLSSDSGLWWRGALDSRFRGNDGWGREKRLSQFGRRCLRIRGCGGVALWIPAFGDLCKTHTAYLTTRFSPPS